MVSRMYAAIGVRTEWLHTLRPATGNWGAEVAGEEARSDVTVIVLNATMAGRTAVPDEVVGYAAVTRGGGIGRVAYVIYDRVQDIARHAAVVNSAIMAMVMAHEIGHLLLPNGAHSEDGLMRAKWNRADFRRLAFLNLQFSGAQVSTIRRNLTATPPQAAPDIESHTSAGFTSLK
jgi:hypothetical protein